ncbi:hypothetical protein [Bacillus sp. JCM 19041]|uniref:hypothetical protein n=1 Tax=Bacillus sp. JCM 19041 TaxID=1460637 RepID=UPI000AB7335F
MHALNKKKALYTLSLIYGLTLLFHFILQLNGGKGNPQNYPIYHSIVYTNHYLLALSA